MKPVDANTHIPYYLQVMTMLRQQVETGIWKPGDQLPSEAELCAIFQVSRTVIRHAFDELTHEGLFVRKKGRGSFVAEPKVKESLVQKLTGFYQDMVEQGHIPVTRVLKQQVVRASGKVANQLALPPETEVFEIERLRSVAGEPIMLATTYIPCALCPGLLKADLSAQSLYALLETEYGLTIKRGYRTIEAVRANEYEAELLEVERDAPLLLLRSTSYDEQERPIEYYHAVHRGDRSRFEVELVRTREQRSLVESVRADRFELPRSNHVIL